MNRTLMIARSVVIIAVAVVLVLVAIFGNLDMQGAFPKIALALLGVLIIAWEAWSWKKRLSSPDN